ncbi:hypothetical protein [Archangium primigenium]|uniref:hypothetical protein n=1 Tax=[Archangium] primigenium TaxID=2792470 RepID=UPI00195779DD|nr:hypothetical protein [Archangium primigenium]MBM7117290.1 hypothetical protein [Archangium primigenium]
MSDTTKWKGRRLGGYEIGERYPGIPEDEGRLHEARHVETGEPALLLMPGTGDDWRTYTPWSVEATNRTEPHGLFLRLKRLPGGRLPTFHELTLGFIRLAGLLARIDGREDIRAPFEREPQPGARPWMKRWGLTGAGIALAAGLALLFWPRSATTPALHRPVDDSPIFTNGQSPSAPAIAYPMPEKPFKEQRKPPCMPETEVEVQGGCWVRHRKDAPCPPGTAEHQGRCYVAVKKPDPEPNSVQP